MAVFQASRCALSAQTCMPFLLESLCAGPPALLSPEPSQASCLCGGQRWVPAKGAVPEGPGQGSAAEHQCGAAYAEGF